MTGPESHLAGDPGPIGVYSDEARRIADIVNMHLEVDRAGNARRWMAFRLDDGGTDGVLYDNPADAADHQTYYKNCGYIQLQLGGMTPKVAATMLEYFRRVRDAGNVPPALVAWHRAHIAKTQRSIR